MAPRRPASTTTAGSAPRRGEPFNAHRFHGTWRMFRDYGNGEIGDDGIHDIDMAVWGLGVETLPKQITARGGRMSLHGNDGDYPDNLNVTYEYPDGRLLVYENYPFAPYGLHGFDDGNVFYGTEGYMVFSRRGAFRVFLGPEGQARPDRRGRPPRSDRLSRTHGKLPRRRPESHSHPRRAGGRAPELRLVHLGEIAYRTRGRLDFDPVTGLFPAATRRTASWERRTASPTDCPTFLEVRSNHVTVFLTAR